MCWQQSRQQSTVILQYSYCEIILVYYRKNEMQYNSDFFQIYSKILAAESPAIYCNSTVFIL